MGNCEEKIVESLGEVLNIIVFPPKRHQFHNAISARKKLEMTVRNIYFMQSFSSLNFRQQRATSKGITVF